MVHRPPLLRRERRQIGQRIGLGRSELSAAQPTKLIPPSGKYGGQRCRVPGSGLEASGLAFRTFALRIPHSAIHHLQRRRPRHLAEQAAPFGEQTVDITAAGVFVRGGHLTAAGLLLHERAHRLGGPAAVLRRHAMLEPALDRDPPVGVFANADEPAQPAWIRARKPVTRKEVGRVEDEVLKWITAILERRREGEAFGP